VSAPVSPRPPFDGQYQQYRPGPEDRKRPRGRWIWAVSGVIVIGLMIVPGILLLSRPRAIQALPMRVTTRAFTISQSINRLSIQSYGGDVRVTGGGHGVKVTEQIGYDSQQGSAPPVIDSVSHGQLSVAVPSCAITACVDWVTVPSDVFVTVVSEGGNVVVSGVAGANLDSGGGSVAATAVHGPLAVASAGGQAALQDIDGPLQVESGGSSVIAENVTGSSATIVTDGGQLTASGLSVQSAFISTAGNGARVTFATAPASADITTDGGRATVRVPGGPYAVTADSEGGHEVVAIPANSAAKSTLDVTTGGSALVIEPATGSQASPQANPSFLPDQNAIPVAPPVPPAPAGP